MSGHAVPVGRRGTVASYDPAKGYGTVTDGTEAWFFHCTAIADGSRDIAEGTEVVFALAPGRRGRHEAVDVLALGD